MILPHGPMDFFFGTASAPLVLVALFRIGGVVWCRRGVAGFHDLGFVVPEFPPPASVAWVLCDVFDFEVRS